MKYRCSWVNLENSLYIEYHDTEWGVPVYDDTKLFEMLILEWAQAWLSWETVLNKRENYRKFFFDFDIEKCVSLSDEYLEKVLQNPWVIRNRRKVFFIRQNAEVFTEIQKEFWSFCDYIWWWTDWKIMKNNIIDCRDTPAKTELSEKISKDLKKRGMIFVGPTIIYAYLQAIWVVDNHEEGCFRK